MDAQLVFANKTPGCPAFSRAYEMHASPFQTSGHSSVIQSPPPEPQTLGHVHSDIQD